MQEFEKIQTFQELLETWEDELFLLCKKVKYKHPEVKIRFLSSSSETCLCRVRIGKDAADLLNENNCFALSPRPEDWSHNILMHDLCVRKLQRILNAPT